MKASENGLWSSVGRYVAVSGVFHLLWEIAQLPLYTIGQTGSISARTFAVAHCTAGDIVIATWTLLAGLVVTRCRTWPRNGRRNVALAAFVIGLVFTGFSEWRNVYITHAWTYTAMMPTMTLAGLEIGLSPIAQWIVVPALSFWWVYRWARVSMP